MLEKIVTILQNQHLLLINKNTGVRGSSERVAYIQELLPTRFEDRGSFRRHYPNKLWTSAFLMQFEFLKSDFINQI